jgi:asparagine synthetase B (glutamine-hydrolysing)
LRNGTAPSTGKKNSRSPIIQARIRNILRAFDEPFAGVISTYFLSQKMAQHVKVAVAGDGADELFGSYRSHRVAAGSEPLPDGATLLTGIGARGCWS